MGRVRLRHIWLGLALISVPAMGRGWPYLPRWPDIAIGVHGAVPDRVLFESMHMGNVKITFEKTTLAKVRAAVGAGKISFNHADAGAGEYSLCYRYFEEGQVHQLGIFSNAEMGGPKHGVTSIEYSETAIFAGNAAGTHSYCPMLSEKVRRVAFGIGIGTQSSYGDFVHALGKPAARRGDEAAWAADRKILLKHGSMGVPFNRWQEINAKFRNGKLSIMIMSQVTSD